MNTNSELGEGAAHKHRTALTNAKMSSSQHDRLFSRCGKLPERGLMPALFRVHLVSQQAQRQGQVAVGERRGRGWRDEEEAAAAAVLFSSLAMATPVICRWFIWQRSWEHLASQR
ncbi:hypothetical protein Q5P01_001391 [Channa striata]|uniref:Uncharacterized protein n=1 Tax=Channa striata TaxID=64152 RepID=A0AA88T575_CHASR|nr:hypothetical protein Q5P01_001391 [Channa striata]